MRFHLTLLAAALLCPTAGIADEKSDESQAAEKVEVLVSLDGTKAGQDRDDNCLKMKLVWCPPGRFKMGSPETEKGRIIESEGQVEVLLSRGFWLGKVRSDTTGVLASSREGTVERPRQSQKREPLSGQLLNLGPSE